MTTDHQEFDAAALEAGRLLFAQSCDFVSGANSLQGLPADSLTEVAFAGRSNVGKSSLINSLTGRNTLARTSNTPGRTRQVNFFNLGDRLMLVDLPGYGYARAPKSDIAAWTALIEAYLRGRPSLRRTCLLIDGRHGLKDSDKTLMAMLDEAAVVYQIVLTKCDKLSDAALAKRREEMNKALAAHAAAYPEIVATSARAGSGVDSLRAGLAALAERQRLR
jgi:GTP-binding protein